MSTVEELHSPLMTLVEGADYLRISRASIYRQVRLGRIPWYQIPGSKQRFLRREDLDALIDASRTQSDELHRAV